MPSRHYLQVPFAEKDRAKALGARWDPLERKWYTESDELAPFRRWMPGGSFDESSAASSPARLIAETPAAYQVGTEPVASVGRGMGLLELLERVQGAVDAVFPQAVWVRVEIHQLRQSQGHWFLELVEHDADGLQLATASAMVWKGQHAVVTRFQQETGLALTEGLKVLVAVQPRFHPRYGLRLEIQGIDGSYTLGDMAARLNRLRETLRREGLYFRNKQIPLPADYTHIAVISPSGAASLGDFRAEADRLAQYGICRFQYFDAVFQGKEAPFSIISALDKALNLHAVTALDAVVIIRGGGSAADLAWLNDEALVRRICACPLPVITGIGHEPDSTLLDEVAARRCDTPSKVAQLILTSIADAVDQAQRCMEVIRTQAGLILHKRTAESEQYYDQVRRQSLAVLERQSWQMRHYRQQIQAASRLYLRRQAEHLDGLMSHCREGGLRHAQGASLQLDMIWSQLRERGARQIRSSEIQCEHLMHVILAVGPQKTLARGYGILRSGERVVTAAAQIPVDSEFSVQMQDGRIVARRIS